jgi:hypothetical protein
MAVKRRRKIMLGRSSATKEGRPNRYRLRLVAEIVNVAVDSSSAAVKAIHEFTTPTNVGCAHGARSAGARFSSMVSSRRTAIADADLRKSKGSTPTRPTLSSMHTL